MALIPCSECGNEVSTAASACPKCGNPILAPSIVIDPTEIQSAPKRMGIGAKIALWVAFLFGAFLLFGAAVGNSPAAKERQRDRDAIKLCWSDQSRRSNDPGEKQFLASTCEALERDFTNKHGRTP